ncbi:hypothetical protein ACFY8C_05035 [Streptomyces flavochromogenes]|uniref:Uncharacterized protein n=1 Tax=Streptomyces flavochromogenes TaxID=68199 RepID=A0ABW6XJN8_9ACTN|nr:hypothetical protein [Streptomyces flavochromogenes]
MHAPSTAAGQTPTAPAAPRATALGGPRARRRAPVLRPAAATDPDPGNGRGASGTVPRAEADAGAGAGAGTGATAGAGTGAGVGGAASDPTGDVVRWAVFCCVLVPVVLLVYGSSLGGAAGTALGLASVTAACRVLLRRSERGMRSEGVRGRRRGWDAP